MPSQKTNKKILVATTFNAEELFSPIQSPEAMKFLGIAQEFGANVEPAFTEAEKKSLRVEFAEVAVEIQNKMVSLVFDEAQDNETAMYIIKRFAKAGLAKSGMIIDLAAIQKKPGPASGPNI